MKEKNYSLDKQTKRDIGAALWQIRYEKHLYIKNVAAKTELPARIIEGMELGKFIQYGALRRLAEFYEKRIKITFE
ncbi:MAG: hypothetical protein IJ532_02805 [Alphaproteobacteria bacterium]|nr:hypothetical protein [Alphaproteobacteria bacterium]